MMARLNAIAHCEALVPVKAMPATAQHRGPDLRPQSAGPATFERNRRPPLLAICASACFVNSGSLVATFGYPATCAGLLPASGGLMAPKFVARAIVPNFRSPFGRMRNLYEREAEALIMRNGSAAVPAGTEGRCCEKAGAPRRCLPPVFARIEILPGPPHTYAHS